MSDDIVVLANTLRAETQAKAGHTDPKAVHDCWAELIRRIAELRDALEQAQRSCKAHHERADANLERAIEYEKRIEQLEAALTRLASPEAFVISRATNEEDRARMRFAEKALESAGDALPEMKKIGKGVGKARPIKPLAPPSVEDSNA